MTGSDYTRRQLLLATGGLSLIAVAGCVGDDDDDSASNNGGEESIEEATGDGFDVFQDGEYDLPEDPGTADFADRTGADLVVVETVWRQEQNPEFVFDPPFVQVDQDTTVEFVNRDGVFHTVTSTESLESRGQSGEFNETISSEGDRFKWVADDTGRQNYYCTPHAGFMYGAIEVV